MNKGLILEIGGGHNPDFRSDVVVDKYLYDNTQRGGVIRVDRPTIVADGEHLPFRDGAFEYSIGKQVMEHMDNIEIFFCELMRVSRAGYLASPSTLREYLFWWPYHNWFITMKNNTLYCCKKTNEKPLFGVLFHYLFKNNPKFKRFMKSMPRHVMDVEYYWKDRINYSIEKQPVLIDFSDDNVIGQFLHNEIFSTFGQRMRHQITRYFPEFMINMAKEILIYKKKKNVNTIDIDKLLVCPICKSDLLHRQNEYFCRNCTKGYIITNNIPNFIV